MGSPIKKRLKAEAKKAKKLAKAEVKSAVAKQASEAASGGSAPATPSAPAAQPPSPGVRFADWVRGILYVILGASLVVALILGQRGAIISLDDIVNSLFAAWTGKIILALIALAFLIYGLKHLRVVR